MIVYMCDATSTSSCQQAVCYKAEFVELHIVVAQVKKYSLIIRYQQIVDQSGKPVVVATLCTPWSRDVAEKRPK